MLVNLMASPAPAVAKIIVIRPVVNVTLCLEEFGDVTGSWTEESIVREIVGNSICPVAGNMLLFGKFVKK